MITEQKQAAQAADRHINRTDGSKVIPIENGLFDLFQGNGWKHQSRFRIIKLRGTKVGTFTRQLIQVNGLNMNQALRADLLKEIH